MKNFCEYLVAAGALKQDKYREACLTQLNEATSLGTIIAQNDLLNLEELTAAIHQQLEQGTTLRQALEQNGHWTEGFARKVNDKILFTSKNIFQIMLEAGFLELGDLIKYFDEFIANISDGECTLQPYAPSDEILAATAQLNARGHTLTPIQQDAPEPAVATVAPASQELAAAESASPPVSAAAQDLPATEGSAPTPVAPVQQPASIADPTEQVHASLKHLSFNFQKFEASLVKEFIQLLTKDFKLKIISDLERLAQTEDCEQINKILVGITAEYQSVLGGAKFVGLEVATMLISEVIKANAEIADRCQDNPQELSKYLLGINHAAINEMFFLKVFLEVSQTEQTYWQTKQRRGAWLAVISRIRSMQL